MNTGDWRELSLYSGAGGGLLGTHLLGWRPVGYVEFDNYCQRVIRARIDDGYLPEAPIFGDVRAFLSDGYAASYTGMVDVITAGFPCQPFSVAGRQLGEDDERNMWPATIDVIRTVKPRWVLLENVPGLISNGYIITVLNDLHKAGYAAYPPLRLSASDIGANHKRERIWIVAHAEQGRRYGRAGQSGQARWSESENGCIEMADAGSQRWIWRRQRWTGDTAGSSTGGRIPTDDSGKWWATEPTMGGMAHGLAAGMDGSPTTEGERLGRVAKNVPDRVSRIKALGNGQVPACAAMAWILTS